MSAERIIINEQDQSQGRVVLADVFNVLVIDDSFTTADPKLYEDSEVFRKAYSTNKYSIIISNLIDAGLGVYVSDAASANTYKDKYKYDVAFILDLRADDSSMTEIDSLIANRKDLLYLVADYGKDESESKDSAGDQNNHLNFKAQYSPAVVVSKTTVPASYCFLMNFAQSVANGNPAWYAIAGVNRGLVNYIDETTRTISDDEFNNCQDKDQQKTSNYNPVMYLSNTYGNVIYGQRTLQFENTALKSVNVRILSNMIKKRIFNICLGLLFDTNDLVLWSEFKGRLGPYLDNMRFNRGLRSYEIIMDQKSQETVDELTVKGYVRIYPTRSAEYFDIDFTLTKAAAEVE